MLNYKGLRKRPTFDTLIDYLEPQNPKTPKPLNIEKFPYHKLSK